MARKKLLHLKSGVTTQVDGSTMPKLPTSSQIELGEIAINYATDYETLAIKNSSGDIVTFSNDKVIMDYVDEKAVDEVSIKYSGDPDPSSASTVEIYIDDTVDPEDIDVYTKAQVDAIIQKLKDDNHLI